MPIFKSSDVDLYFESAGAGDPVLFIQGVGVIGRGWKPQTDPMSKSFKTIIFDNRGIGQSKLRSTKLDIECMADDALTLMDHLGIKAAHVVGHSMGGSIALELAVKHPERVRSLSLLCTFSKGNQATRLNSRMLWLGIRSRIGTRASRRHAFLAMLYSKLFLSDHPSIKTLAETTGNLVGRDLADSPAIIMRQLKALSRHDLHASLNVLASIPTLVVSAKEDPIALPRFGSDLATKIPGAKYILLENASHGIVLERSDEINKILLHWFESVSSSLR